MTNTPILQGRRFNSQHRLAKAIGSGNLTILKRSRTSLITALSNISPRNQLCTVAEAPDSTPESTRRSPDVLESYAERPKVLSDIMNVKELSAWLSGFAEKSQEHYKRGLIIKQHNHGDCENLTIETKTSSTATSPTSSIGISSPREQGATKTSKILRQAFTSSRRFQDDEKSKGSTVPCSPSSSLGSFRSAVQKIQAVRSNDRPAQSSKGAAPSTKTGTTRSPSHNVSEVNIMLAPCRDGPSTTIQRADSQEDETAATINRAPSQDESVATIKRSDSQDDSVATIKRTDSDDQSVATVEQRKTPHQTTATKHFDSNWSQSSDAFVTITPTCSLEEADVGSIRECSRPEDADSTYSGMDGHDDLLNVVTESWDSEASDRWWEESDKFVQMDDTTGHNTKSSRLSVSQGNYYQTDSCRRSAFGATQGRESTGSFPYQQSHAQNGFSFPSKKIVLPIRQVDKRNKLVNRTLTSGTLDLICCNGQEERPKYSIESTLSSDDSRGSTYSQDSKQPSISPDAMKSKMARAFLNNSNGWSSESQRGRESSEFGPIRPRLGKVTRKTLDPKDLPFLQGNHHKTEQRSMKGSSDTDFSAKISKFGGRKSMVERRKDQLERRWTECKTAKHVKKVKWGVCPKTGAYKKTVVLDVQYS